MTSEAPAPAPTGAPYAEVRETHAAVVVMLGDRVFKVKKPVDLGFLDFSTSELRDAACAQELALNRRMAPDVYLGLGHLEQPGRPVETAVVMRRMPEDRRLSTLVLRGEPVGDDLRALARDLAALHVAGGADPVLQRQALRDPLLRRWRDSIAHVRRLGEHLDVGVDTVALDEVSRRVEQFLAGRAQLLEQRLLDGFVVDGHGDLQADDVFCLRDGPRALDCLEFDDALRHIDRLDDAAFLAMDLEHLGAEQLGHDFLAAYVDFTADPAPDSLRHHYVAYRAFVRAKVACLRVTQGDPGAAARAAGFTALALRHLRLGAVRLVLVGGLPGTGKSTLAGLLADQHGSVLLSSDRIRKEAAGISPDQPVPEAFRAGLYSPASTRATYGELLRRAALLLARGESVVLDASWTDEERRQAAREVARDATADLVELRCYAPAALAARRMRERRSGPSDADEAIAARMARHEDDWPTATVVPTIGSPAHALAEAEAVLSSPALVPVPGV